MGSSVFPAIPYCLTLEFMKRTILTFTASCSLFCISQFGSPLAVGQEPVKAGADAATGRGSIRLVGPLQNRESPEAAPRTARLDRHQMNLPEAARAPQELSESLRGAGETTGEPSNLMSPSGIGAEAAGQLILTPTGPIWIAASDDTQIAIPRTASSADLPAWEPAPLEPEANPRLELPQEETPPLSLGVADSGFPTGTVHNPHASPGEDVDASQTPPVERSREPALLSLDPVPQTEHAKERPRELESNDATRNDASNPGVQAADEADETSAAPAVELPRELSEQALSLEMLERRDRIRNCLQVYFQQPTSVSQRSPWGVMHTLISYGVDSEVVAGGRRVNAIGWLCWNQPCRGQQLFYLRNNELAARLGPGVQGHAGQFLAMLAQSKVKSSFEMRVQGKSMTVADLVAYEQATCEPKSELTFKLIGLVHYLGSEGKWENRHGRWDIERLIREELAQPVIGAACGGTHRMMGFSFALRQREREGLPIDGQWARARKFVDDFHEYTLKLRNSDGSFSTNWFEGRGGDPDRNRRLQTTGHILEWLVFSLPEERLTDPEIVESVDYLTNLMLSYRTQNWEIGPRGHAIRALALYDERVFGGKPGQREYLRGDRQSNRVR